MTTQVFEMDFDTGKLVKATNQSLQVGQVIFLNGYGQDEHSHKRMAVYELTEDGFKTVNLDDYTLRNLHGWEVKPIEKKFGIGLYYKAGDMATADEIAEALPKATELLRQQNEEREKATKAGNELKANYEAWLKANRPEWAKAIIIAELKEDKSDPMTDYWGSQTVKKLLLAFSPSERNNFNELRQAARNAKETAFLADLGKEGENRENYSGGAGYYLGKHRYHGWNVSKVNLSWNITNVFAQEDIRIQKEEAKPSIVAKAATGSQARVNINKAKNGIELYFPGKPSTSVLDDLKANGWRWSRFNSCWYNRDGATSRRFAAKYVPDGVITHDGIGGHDAALVQAQEDAASDNFCQANNI
jgi:hypothetical protein